MKEIIKVNGMMCEGCEKRVHNAISKLEGVAFTKESSVNHEVEIEFDDTLVSLDDIKETIEEIGYDVV